MNIWNFRKNCGGIIKTNNANVSNMTSMINRVGVNDVKFRDGYLNFPIRPIKRDITLLKIFKVITTVVNKIEMKEYTPVGTFPITKNKTPEYIAYIQLHLYKEHISRYPFIYLSNGTVCINKVKAINTIYTALGKIDISIDHKRQLIVTIEKILKNLQL